MIDERINEIYVQLRSDIKKIVASIIEEYASTETDIMPDTIKMICNLALDKALQAHNDIETAWIKVLKGGASPAREMGKLSAFDQASGKIAELRALEAEMEATRHQAQTSWNYYIKVAEDVDMEGSPFNNPFENEMGGYVV